LVWGGAPPTAAWYLMRVSAKGIKGEMILIQKGRGNGRAPVRRFFGLQVIGRDEHQESHGADKKHVDKFLSHD